MKLRMAGLLVISAGAWSAPAAAQTSSNSGDASMDKLLVEVRQLRLALERATAAWPKMQIAMQRMQLQQGQVDRVSKQVEDLRDQVAKSASHGVKIAGELKQFEIRVNSETDPARRREFEEAMKMMKLQVEQETATEGQLRSREAEAVSRLQGEQAKLTELSDQLNSLERSLGPGRP